MRSMVYPFPLVSKVVVFGRTQQLTLEITRNRAVLHVRTLDGKLMISIDVSRDAEFSPETILREIERG